MSKVHLRYIDEVHVKIETDPDVIMELADHFKWKAENYLYHPKYKARVWDGNITLVNRLTGIVYSGLAQRIQKFCKLNDYEFTFDDRLCYDNISRNEFIEHIKNLNLPDWLELRDYQIDSCVKCIRSRRRTLLSPTSSGKSLMIYLLYTWYTKKTLIIVPSTGLVDQFKSDIESYGFKGSISTTMGGLDKSLNIDADIVIATWQSLNNGRTQVDKNWYDQFDVVFGDECHGASAVQFIKIMESMKKTRYRFGTTGSIGTNQLKVATVEGLFGPPYAPITTREMIDSGYASDIEIKCIVLKYPESIRKEFNNYIDPKTGKKRRRTYQEEIEFITTNEKRLNFIKNLSLSLKGNKLIFFRIIEHGKALYAALDGESTYYIDGSVKSEREDIRKAIELEENATLIASLGTTSTGVSIRKLHYAIVGHPTKSEIKIPQSIGRMLRQHSDKTHAVMFDIVDDLSWGRSKNYVLGHFEKRVQMYSNAEFDYKIYTVGM